MREILADRKSGKTTSFKGAEGFDLLQTLLETDLYKGREENIINEIIFMFLAGSKTVQLTTTNIICFAKECPETGAKLQAEIDSKIGPIQDDIAGKFSKDLADEFDYLKCCFSESLRLAPPLSFSTYASFD